MEIYLIRHGHCYDSIMKYYDHEKKAMNPPLTEKGIKQANELALRLSTIHFDKIYCSDLLRAVHLMMLVILANSDSIMLNFRMR